MNDYKLPIKVELVLLTTQVINAKEIHLNFLQQKGSNWLLPSLYLTSEQTADEVALEIAKGLGLNKPQFFETYTEVNRDDNGEGRYISIVYRVLVAKDEISLPDEHNYRWTNYFLQVENAPNTIEERPVINVINEIKNKRGVAFLDDVIAVLPKQFSTRDARNLCQLLKGKPQEFVIFQRHLEKDEKIKLIKLPEEPNGKGRPAKIYEKL